MLIKKLFNNRYIKIDLSKNAKFPYYLKGIMVFFTPSSYYQKQLDSYLSANKDEEYIADRVNYYNKITKNFTLSKEKTIKAFRKEKKRTYFFDLYRYLIYFNQNFKIAYLFGDIVDVPSIPSLLKSRPIGSDNQNSVLLNLDRVRHFIFLDDTIAFEDKKDILVWRGKAHQKHRKQFLEKFYTHPLCDVGQIIKKKDKSSIPWEKPKLYVKEHLKYKFILTIEGNDVASNLKWVMSSNSLAFMVKPKYETWFMEGRLIPNHHYVLLKDDYSDLEEKIQYYSSHIEEAKSIIENAHEYIAQFQNTKREDTISLKVLSKYFEYSSQS